MTSVYYFEIFEKIEANKLALDSIIVWPFVSISEGVEEEQ